MPFHSAVVSVFPSIVRPAATSGLPRSSRLRAAWVERGRDLCRFVACHLLAKHVANFESHLVARRPDAGHHGERQHDFVARRIGLCDGQILGQNLLLRGSILRRAPPSAQHERRFRGQRAVVAAGSDLCQGRFGAVVANRCQHSSRSPSSDRPKALAVRSCRSGPRPTPRADRRILATAAEPSDHLACGNPDRRWRRRSASRRRAFPSSHAGRRGSLFHRGSVRRRAPSRLPLRRRTRTQRPLPFDSESSIVPSIRMPLVLPTPSRIVTDIRRGESILESQREKSRRCTSLAGGVEMACFRLIARKQGTDCRVPVPS